MLGIEELLDFYASLYKTDLEYWIKEEMQIRQELVSLIALLFIGIQENEGFKLQFNAHCKHKFLSPQKAARDDGGQKRNIERGLLRHAGSAEVQTNALICACLLPQET